MGGGQIPCAGPSRPIPPRPGRGSGPGRRCRRPGGRFWGPRAREGTRISAVGAMIFGDVDTAFNFVWVFGARCSLLSVAALSGQLLQGRT